MQFSISDEVKGIRGSNVLRRSDAYRAAPAISATLTTDCLLEVKVNLAGALMQLGYQAAVPAVYGQLYEESELVLLSALKLGQIIILTGNTRTGNVGLGRFGDAVDSHRHKICVIPLPSSPQYAKFISPRFFLEGSDMIRFAGAACSRDFRSTNLEAVISWCSETCQPSQHCVGIDCDK